VPFTAGRARNVGFDRLLATHPEVEFVQFLDGDCMLDAQWIERAGQLLETDERLVIACGRRREMFPERSIYNRMCDIEWDTPVGEASACGGDFLVRVRAFREIGGFDASLIAGEEPEMCHRLRSRGGRISRAPFEMTLHDAAMTSFGQWCRRVERAGYAYFRVAAKHVSSPERIWVREVASIAVWSTWPLAVALAACVTPWAWLGLLIYPLQWLRTERRLQADRGLEGPLARRYAAACVLGKFLEMRGVLRALVDLLSGRRSGIIEYKSPLTAQK
jgi:cellulose synthase/poly-beta-1,6-N-acetylglucosamine synthase-like glycosyltransferase